MQMKKKLISSLADLGAPWEKPVPKKIQIFLRKSWVDLPQGRRSQMDPLLLIPIPI